MHSTEGLPLPPRPSAEHYRKTAKDLLAAVRSAEPDAVEQWGREWLGRVARAAGVAVSERTLDEQGRRIAAYWSGDTKRFHRMPPARKTLASAQLFLARAHGFPSWAALLRHIDELGRQGSGVGRFEAAVDAIISGDSETLRRMLREHPELVTARSSRGHGCTLLHYVSANGVEGYRQKTPPNIVEITSLLLASGADVNATAHCYGDDDAVLMLTATSMHPRNAGVMIPMLETLVAAGADIHHQDGGYPVVRACLDNGQPEAAAWLAEHGAALDLESAAGIDRIDRVRAFVGPDGTLMNGATRIQLLDGMRNACWYGAIGVVRYLLDAGFEVNSRFGAGTHFADGATCLHVAAYAGKADLVDLLLASGAEPDARDTTWNATPLDWVNEARANGELNHAKAAHERIVAALTGPRG